MASPRSIAPLLLVLALLAAPAATGAQSSAPTDGAAPSALPATEPDSGVPDQPALPPSAGSASGVVGLPPIEGTVWRLTHVAPRPDGSAAAVPPDVAAWLTLRGGRLEGSTGCAPLSGTYGRVDQAVRLSLDAPGGDDCPAIPVVVTAGMTGGLVRATDYAIMPAEDGNDAELVLLDAHGTDLLHFAPDDVGSLNDESWQLASVIVDGKTTPALASQAAVLAFDADGGSPSLRRSRGPLVGSSGCNGIVAAYERRADVLRLSDLETTGAPCASDATAQEAAMLAVLGSAELRLDLPPDRLVIIDPRTGDRLELVTSTPLEGSTWLLAAIPGVTLGDGPVTLRLQGGLLSGEGPCGPYRGTYATDGRLIRFHDLRGPGIEGCPDRQRQRKLLQALERAVLLDRDQPQLRLLDAGGALVARFRRPLGP